MPERSPSSPAHGLKPDQHPDGPRGESPSTSPGSATPSPSLGRRAVWNTLANWAGTGVATFASIILTPYLIHHLDAESFGLYQISRQAVTYLALFDMGVLGATKRYISQAIAARDDARVNALVNGGFVLYGGLAVAGLLASGLVALAAPAFFGVTPAIETETRHLFLALGIWWALTMLLTPLRSILIGHQRYDLQSVIIAGGWILTVGLVVVLFETGHAGLGTIGGAFIVAATCQLLSAVLFAHRIQPTLNWGFRHVNGSTLRTLFGFGSWNMLYTIAGLLLWSSDSIVIGRMLGPEVVPLYVVPFMLIHYGRIVSLGFADQLVPIAGGHAAARDRDGLKISLVRGTRISLILTLACNGVLLLLAKDLLRLWVGPELAAGWIIYAYLMISFWAVYAQQPIYLILLGAGDIRAPAIVALAATVGTLALKILALAWFDLGVEAIALLNCVLVLPVMLIYMPWCGCQLVGLNLRRLYLEAYLGPLLSFLPVAVIGYEVLRHIPPLNLLELIVAGLVLAGSYLALAFLTFSASERSAIRGFLRRPFSPDSRKTSQ